MNIFHRNIIIINNFSSNSNNSKVNLGSNSHSYSKVEFNNSHKYHSNNSIRGILIRVRG